MVYMVPGSQVQADKTEGGRAGGKRSRYGLIVSVVLNLLLVAVLFSVIGIPGEGPVGPAKTADDRTMNGTMELLMAHYVIRPVNGSSGTWGHANWALSGSDIENDSINFDARVAENMGAHPNRCIFIKVSISEPGSQNGWESIGCEEQRRVVFVKEELLGEWYSAWMTGRPNLFGPGYTYSVPAGSPVELNITGVLLTTASHVTPTSTSISRDLIEYEGQIRWEYHPAMDWSRADWLAS